MSAPSLQSYRVWDAPTRWFHWINFACVVGLAAIGIAILYEKELGVTDGGKILLKTTHVWIGYVFASEFSVAYRLGLRRQSLCEMVRHPAVPSRLWCGLEGLST